jgi:3,4-dihydroxy 2-butanone 4-phosphate synthase/GTP cyclohydrolase II
MNMPFNTVEQAVAAIAAGKLIIVADDEDRENEGDLICAAGLVTAESINFMIKKAGGLICLALAGERVDQLELAPMADSNLDEYRTAYTVSVDAGPRRSAPSSIRRRFPATSVAAVTSFRCARETAACSSASVTRRPQ